MFMIRDKNHKKNGKVVSFFSSSVFCGFLFIWWKNIYNIIHRKNKALLLYSLLHPFPQYQISNTMFSFFPYLFVIFHFSKKIYSGFHVVTFSVHLFTLFKFWNKIKALSYLLMTLTRIWHTHKNLHKTVSTHDLFISFFKYL